MYYFGLFFKYRISIDYEYLVIGQVVIELISACAFYLISLKLLNIRKLSVLCSLIFLNLIYYNEGYHIMLEPLVIFFTLWGFVAIFYCPNVFGYAAGGVLLGLAFLSKQYALLGFVPFCIFAILSINRVKQKVYCIVVFFAFLFFSICAFLLYEKLFFKIDFQELLCQIFPKTGKQYAIFENKLPKLFSYLCRFSISIYLIPIVSVFIFRFNYIFKNQLLTTIIAAHIVFLVPLYIIQFTHYNMLFLPYSILLLGYLIKEFNQNYILSAIFGILAIIYMVLPIRTYVSFVTQQERLEQYKLARALKAIIPPSAKVALNSNEEQYYLSNLKPCDLKNSSYAFISFLTDDLIYLKADFVIFDFNHIPDTLRLKNVYHFAYYKSINSKVLIYKSFNFNNSEMEAMFDKNY